MRKMLCQRIAQFEDAVFIAAGQVRNGNVIPHICLNVIAFDSFSEIEQNAETGCCKGIAAVGRLLIPVLRLRKIFWQAGSPGLVIFPKFKLCVGIALCRLFKQSLSQRFGWRSSRRAFLTKAITGCRGAQDRRSQNERPPFADDP